MEKGKTTLAQSADDPRSLLQQFKQNPLMFLAEWFYNNRTPILPTPHSAKSPITIVCISDTHNTKPDLPDGDVLIHAGDLTVHGTFEEWQAQLDWLNSHPHPHKIVVAGNHDYLLDAVFIRERPERITVREGATASDINWGTIKYLDDSAITLDIGPRKLTIYGSPQTPVSGKWAFQYAISEDYWLKRFPAKTDIVISHGPPLGHLDFYQSHRGCAWLLKELWRIKPRLFICGHIHSGRGRLDLAWDNIQKHYDAMRTGKGRYFSLLLLIFSYLKEKIARILGRRTIGTTTLINAATVAGPRNIYSRPATVVEI